MWLQKKMEQLVHLFLETTFMNPPAGFDTVIMQSTASLPKISFANSVCGLMYQVPDYKPTSYEASLLPILQKAGQLMPNQ